MRLMHRDADRFQRALGGGPGLRGEVAAGETAHLVATAESLTVLTRALPAPRPEFVRALKERLVLEARTRPVAAGPPRAALAPVASRQAPPRPMVLVIGRGLPRMLAGAVATLLLVGAVVGVAARSSLPGGGLYPVKGWMNSVAVQLAGSDLERGITHLSQAQGHISDARALADRDERDADRYVEALTAAADSVRQGQRELGVAYDSTGNPQALLAGRDFTTRARPQVEALRPDVPAAALPALAELLSLIDQTQSATLRKLSTCAPSCISVIDLRSAQNAVGGAPLPSATLPAAPTTATVPSGVGTVASVPGGPVTAPPAVTGGSGGVVVGGPSGGATLSGGGATVNSPKVTISVPILPSVPSVPVVVPVPSVTVGPGGITATVPPVTLGSVTVTVPVPGITLPLPPLP